MHRLLKRQLRRCFAADAEVPPETAQLLDMVDRAYAQNDEDRAMLERSLELSSDELLEANGELNALFSSLPDLFVRVDRHAVVVDLRGGIEGDPNVAGDPAGRGSLWDLLAPDAATAIREVFAGGEARRVTVQYQIGEGDDAPHYEARLLPLPRSDVMVVIRDISDGVQATQAEARRREQVARSHAMEEFAYVASHDLRAPLRAIAQLSTWLAEDLEDTLPEDSKKQLSLLRRRVKRMDDLMVGLLDYSRVGREKVLIETVDAAELVAGVIDLLDDERFTFTVAPLPRLSTARGPLERVFLNLITNAVKHHDKAEGHIRIGVEERADEVVFFVEDDGPGIPESARERVFKMFQKLVRRDDVEGSGMGLALIRRIVEEAGGVISVSDAASGGARFSFTWPLTWPTGRR